MMLRLGMNAATHAAGGFVLGVTGALAACTLAQVAARAARRAARTSMTSSGLGAAAPDRQPFDPAPQVPPEDR